MRAQIDFIWYMINVNTGLVRYKDINGVTQETSIENTAIDTHLRTAPGRWMQQKLGFPRNEKYDSMLRAYSDPMLFIGDSAVMIQELIYEGIGVENNFQLICFKRNPSGNPTTYNFYSKMGLDLAGFVDSVTEGIEVGMLETGLAALLKSFGKTMFEIPCDGSIKENIKVNLDGLVVADKLNYEMVKNLVNFGSNHFTIPASFLNNDGDNFGITHQDPGMQGTGAADANFDNGFFAGGLNSNENWIYESETEGDVIIEGNITITGQGLIIEKSGGSIATPLVFGLYLATDKSAGQYFDPVRDAGLSGLTKLVTNSVSLVPNKQGDVFGPPYLRDGDTTNVIIAPGNTIQIAPAIAKTIPFKGTIHLKANEKLYFMGFQDGQYSVINSGNFELSFTSSALPTRSWAITWFDLFKLLIQEINQAASNQYITYNYGFQSSLLMEKLNMLITSGDALAASGDSNYSRFYSIFQLDPQPSNNLLIPYGPTIKTCLDDAFDAVNAIYCCSLGIAPGDGITPDNIFVERKQYTYNTNGPTMDVGQVGNFKVRLMEELMFNAIRVGYAPQTYDQKSGKYEINTTAEYISNLKSLTQKFLEIKCPYRADSYGIERIRSGTQSSGQNSTTSNGGDNDVFIINAQTKNSFNDYQLNSFTSEVTDYSQNLNNNIKLIQNLAAQGLDTNLIDGEYFSLNNSPSLFVFSEPTLAGTNKVINIEYDGNLLGSPANSVTGLGPDWVKIDVLINGVVFDTITYYSTSTDVAFHRNVPTITRSMLLNDMICIRTSTSLTAGGQIDNVQIFVTNTDTTAYWDANGQAIPIMPGVLCTYLALPNINSSTVIYHTQNTPVLTTSFQYYQFNSLLGNSNFTPSFSVTNFAVGSNTESVQYKLFRNGTSIAEMVFNGIGNPVPQIQTEEIGITQMQIGDIYYILSFTGNLFVQVTNWFLTFESQIGVRNLTRVQYDNVSGIPPLVFDANGKPVWNQSGCPYNVEELTPKRMAIQWWPYIKSVCYNQINSSFLFSSLSKNQYFSTTLNGVTIKENSDMAVGLMPDGFFKPFEIAMDVMTPRTFSETMTGAASCLITGNFFSFPIKGFPNDVQQQPALNETQNWKIRPTYDTDVSKLIKLPVDGLKTLTMEPNSIFASFLNPIKSVPINQTLNPKYRTPDPDLFLFSTTVSGWLNRKGYTNPWYVGQSIPLQHFTNGLNDTVVKFYDSNNKLKSTTALTVQATMAMASPIQTVQGAIPTTGLSAGCYYYIVNAGGIDQLQSECIELRIPDPDDRVLMIEYSNSENKSLTVFDTGFLPCFYVKGFNDNKGKPDYVGAVFIDQPQDYVILNGITYRTRELWIGMDDGVPDYVIEKINEIMQLDTIFIEGVQYTMDQGAKYEQTFTKGNPKKFWKMTLRLAKNNQGITASNGAPVNDSSLALTFDGNMFSPNASNIAQNPNPAVIGMTITTS